MQNKKLSIALFIDSFFPMVDGVVMVVDNYARRLSKFADVTVFAPHGREDYDDSVLPYKVVRSLRLRVIGLDYDLPLPALDSNLQKILKESNFDIVHIHSPFSLGKLGVAYAKKKKIPVIATMHSQYKQDFYKVTKSNALTETLLKGIMKVFNKCYECWAVNSELAKVFLEYGANTLPKVQNNGTDITLIEDKSFISNLKAKHNIKEDEKIFLFVGRIHAIKNIFFTLDALKQLKEEGFKFKMLYIGTGPDEKELSAKIIEYGMENEVILVGKVTDRILMTQYYNMADLFLFPSLYDASSLVQIEAASQKTPTLFIRGAVTAGTTTEDVNSFQCENNLQSFVDKIKQIFANKDYYEKVCEGAYRDLYVSWDKAVEEVYNDYLKIINEYKKTLTPKDKKVKATIRAKKIKTIAKETEKITKKSLNKTKKNEKIELKQKIRAKKGR